MSTTATPDLLVCGLGPAGAVAATVAARAGLRVLGIDRRRVPGLPVQCAEFVPAMLGGDVPAVLAAQRQAIARMDTYLGAGVEVTPDFRGRMIDRADFDAALVAEARAAGAEIRMDTLLRRITPEGVAVLADGTQFAAKAIIGADGPRSVVGAAIGAPNADVVESRQITVDLLRPHDGTDIFLRPEIAGGYEWLFPKGERANLGLGVAPQYRDRLKPLLEALHAQLVSEGRVGATIHATTGGAIPVGGMTGPVGRLGAVPVLLAGDAAGLTNPVTGAGIPAAVTSGQLAGEAAVALLAGDADARADYAEELDALYGRSLALARDRRRALMARYATGEPPGPAALRRAWIAYPEYWAEARTTAPAA
ncbi:MAG: geranylgeranyl reductase family protein [Limimaricola sp.]|uniref:geranylgeranyl reductase family protein n=1 Tax=Limimaricola sp. TaxID=2211665 RepID=UPI001E075615|nr:geranylgeranyl reductase family protein [Limimaricola sp.]MBI1418942.1 geranylgeranyl reductase family protein [Limimaricola sp.]